MTGSHAPPTASPRLSVALCTFEGARFLEAQLESLASQSRLPDELVACDDGSRDGTASILEAFARRAPFPVRVVVNNATLGSTANFEKAIGLCSGDLIATCDQDDAWMPEKIARTLAVFAEDPRLGLVFTDAEVVGENLSPLGHRLWDAVGFGPGLRRLVREDRAFEALLRQWIVTGATMTFRAAHRALVLPIPRAWVHDAWIALLVAAVVPLGLLEEPTIRYRQHGAQQFGASLASPAQAFRRAREVGAAQFGLELERFILARDRLRAWSAQVRDPSVLLLLEGKVAHQELRLAISRSGSRPARLAAATGELLRGGYSRYSARTYYALKDMFL
jgi:glycosyltransferase involved in cell wall biosynthesis